MCLSGIIPAYDEELPIEKISQVIHAYLRRQPHPVEINVVE
jgi:hypothetical protein